jgi:hypothetical protein
MAVQGRPVGTAQAMAGQGLQSPRLQPNSAAQPAAAYQLGILQLPPPQPPVNGSGMGPCPRAATPLLRPAQLSVLQDAAGLGWMQPGNIVGAHAQGAGYRGVNLQSRSVSVGGSGNSCGSDGPALSPTLTLGPTSSTCNSG